MPSVLDMQRLQEELMTPPTQAELDSFVVTLPGGAVSNSPMPATALLNPLIPSTSSVSDSASSTFGPSTSRADPSPLRHSAPMRVQPPALLDLPQFQRNANMGSQPPTPLPIGPHQLGQVVIHTLQPLSPSICATFVDGKFSFGCSHCFNF